MTGEKSASASLKKICLYFRKELARQGHKQHKIKATNVASAYMARVNIQDPSQNTKLVQATLVTRPTEIPIRLEYSTVRYFRSFKSPDPGRKSGLEEWKKWKSQWLEPERPTGEWEMTKLAGIFSKIFHLQPLCFPLEFEWKTDIAEEGKPTTFGSAEHRSNGDIRIRIDPTDHTAVKRISGHSAALLSTFLHELTHGIFYAFCCDGAKYHDDLDYCRRKGKVLWDHLAGNHHCFGWFLVACYIDLCFEECLGFQGHLFSFRSIYQEVFAGGDVSAEDWKLFFSLFTWEEVTKLYGYLHVHDDKKQDERKIFFSFLMCDLRVMQVWAEEFERSQQG